VVVLGRGEADVAKYMIQGSYTQSGVQGVLKEGGSGRRDAVAKLLADLGGSLDAFYFAFGEDDVYVIADVPDNITAAAIALTVGAAGAVRIRTVVLLTPEEVDRATQQSVNYRPPGA
jgi:uncharacterized protein with GYD domain